MEFEEWEPIYEEILAYFAFSRDGDEEAAGVLASLLTRDDCADLAALCSGNTVTICGNAPCLGDDLDRITGKVFAADAAAAVLFNAGIRPDAVFTDLDGATDEFLEMNCQGTIMVIHAHGDNIPLLRAWVLLFPGPVVGTTQARPSPPLHNFGGFTDGDRAAFAAHSLGAGQILFAGFDLDDQDVDFVKRGKLQWARRLLRLIGYAC